MTAAEVVDLSESRPIRSRRRSPSRSQNRQCTAHKKNGKRCQAYAISGGTVCNKHGGSAPQVIARARQRLLAAVDPMAARLVEIALDKKLAPSDNLKAITWVLERFGFDLKQQVEVSVTQLDEARSKLLDLLAEQVKGKSLPVELDDPNIVDAEIVEEPPPKQGEPRPTGESEPPRYGRE